MNPWTVEYSPRAAAQTRGLPASAFEALTHTLAQVIRDPWAATWPDRPGTPFAAWRWTSFDDDQGAVHVRLDAAERLVWVYDVTWIGP
ncbi:hypothetical protein [Actinomadura kijaniata]|uniref:hypothetical protein n=1 Tax=Actinomadura kijaniata TaxID=46161 RepID=UPI0008304913|nr:hypothetical protein [Actinomadura kijaniata]